MSQDNKFSNRELLAKNIIKLRTKRNIRREELSLALGYDNSYISKLEKSEINITIDKLTLIANYFEISIKELFTE